MFIYQATVVGTNDYNQAGGRVDYNLSEKDQLFARYSYYGGYDLNPVSVWGTSVPGFPTRDNSSTDAGELSSTHSFSPTLNNSARFTVLRYLFDFDLRENQTPPSALGFEYNSASALGVLRSPALVSVEVEMTWCRGGVRYAAKCPGRTTGNLVGLPGFEPGTSCTPSKRASQAAPQPEAPSVAHGVLSIGSAESRSGCGILIKVRRVVHKGT